MPRLPTAEDFPSNIVLAIVPPPNDKPPANVLLLLHGLGDTDAPFTGLARQLNLPETACISIQGPTPLPFGLGGYHWGDDILLDQASGKMDFDTGFTRATEMLKSKVITDSLINKCGYTPRQILFFGYGQGGMAALAVAKLLDADELGGLVSVGGPLPVSAKLQTMQNKAKTPLLVAGGSSQSLVTSLAVKTLKETFEAVQIVQWNRPGDGMPNDRSEMLPIMGFFARRLRSAAGVPSGAVELT